MNHPTLEMNVRQGREDPALIIQKSWKTRARGIEILLHGRTFRVESLDCFEETPFPNECDQLFNVLQRLHGPRDRVPCV